MTARRKTTADPVARAEHAAWVEAAKRPGTIVRRSVGEVRIAVEVTRPDAQRRLGSLDITDWIRRAMTPELAGEKSPRRRRCGC